MKSHPGARWSLTEYRPILPCAARAASELGVLGRCGSENAGGRRAGVTRCMGLSRTARACNLSKYGISSAKFGPHHPARSPSRQLQ
jgi:hypothetical protein